MKLTLEKPLPVVLGQKWPWSTPRRYVISAEFVPAKKEVKIAGEEWNEVIGLSKEASKSLDLTIQYLDTVITELNVTIEKLEDSVGLTGNSDWEV